MPTFVGGFGCNSPERHAADPGVVRAAIAAANSIIVSGVMFELAVRVGLALFLVAGYLSAYRHAKDSAATGAAHRSTNSLRRAASIVLCVVMSLSAATALCSDWDGPFLLQLFASLIGLSVNICWFYAGCVGLIATKQTNTATP
jgi:hypothetical protein